MRHTLLLSTRFLPSFLTFATCGILGLNAHAATYTVTSTSEFGAGSLTQAINDANGTKEADTIVFDESIFSTPQTITITNDLPSVSGTLAINGPTGSSARLTLDRVGQFGTYGIFLGFGDSSLSLSDLTLTGFLNGLQFRGTGLLNIQRCTFSGTNYGVLRSDGPTRVENCTFKGGIRDAISADYNAPVKVNSCTFAGNNVGIRTGYQSPASVSNSLLVGNTENIAGDYDFGEADVQFDAYTVRSGTAAQAGLETTDNLNDVVLKDNGGSALTIALSPFGSAYNAGDPSFDSTNIPTDQRGVGFSRVVGGRVDLGAFEVQPKINKAPIAEPDFYNTNEDIGFVISGPLGLLGNDSDPDGTPLSSVLVTGPSNGIVSLNPDGSFFYQPNSGFSGTDSFTYFATDGELSSSPTTVTINVAPVNKAPVVSNVSLSPSAPLSSDDLTVTFAVIDADNDKLSYTYLWKKNDVVIEGQSGATLPASETEDGDKITVTVTANDGTVDSLPVESDPVTIKNLAPTVESLSPQNESDKVGNKRTFTMTISDGNGAKDIKEAWLLINTRLNWAEGATLIYVPDAGTPTSGLLYLRRGDIFPSPIRIGAGATAGAVLDNGAVRVVGSEVEVKVSKDGNSVTLSIPATIRDGLVGQNKLFTRVVDRSGATDSAALPGDNGYRRFGAYTVSPQFSGQDNSAPVLSGLSPRVANTRIPSAGVQLQTFVFYAKDENGIGDMESLWFMVGKVPNWSKSATFVYQHRTRRLYLRSDDGSTFLGGGQIGTAGTIENSKVKVDLSKVQVIIYADGKTMGLRLPLQPKSGLVGQNTIWLRTQDLKGAAAVGSDAQGFVSSGSWNVVQSAPANSPSAPSGGNS